MGQRGAALGRAPQAPASWVEASSDPSSGPLPYPLLSARPGPPPRRNLSGNPLECDCGLAWLPRWAEEQRVRVLRPEAATCAGPSPVAGRPLLGVPLSDGGCGEYGWSGPAGAFLLGRFW